MEKARYCAAGISLECEMQFGKSTTQLNLHHRKNKNVFLAVCFSQVFPAGFRGAKTL